MTTYMAQVILTDDYGRQTRKSYQSQDFIDFPTAMVALTNLVTDLQAVTELGVVRTYLTEETVIAEAPASGANIDAGMSLTVVKADTKKATIKVPAPPASVINPDGTVDLTATAITDFVGNFQSGGGWTVSDGEIVTSVVKGSIDKA